jgi:hypothetical protein
MLGNNQTEKHHGRSDDQVAGSAEDILVELAGAMQGGEKADQEDNDG